MCSGFYTPCPQGVATMMPPAAPVPPLYPIFISFTMFVLVDLFISMLNIFFISISLYERLYYKAVTIDLIYGCKVTTIK